MSDEQFAQNWVQNSFRKWANHLYTSDSVMLKSIMVLQKKARKWKKKQEKNMNSKKEDKSRKCQRKYNPLCTIQSTILYIWHFSLFQMQIHIFTRHVRVVLNTIFLTANNKIYIHEIMVLLFSVFSIFISSFGLRNTSNDQRKEINEDELHTIDEFLPYSGD